MDILFTAPRYRGATARLPRVMARQIVCVPEKLGFTLARQGGSHMIYKNSAGTRYRALSRG
jgi:predicted RNA binding protein YcfA (HicA-like mRNA interferase family)